MNQTLDIITFEVRHPDTGKSWEFTDLASLKAFMEWKQDDYIANLEAWAKIKL